MELLAEVNCELGVTVLVSLHRWSTPLPSVPAPSRCGFGEVVFDGPTHELSPARLRALYGTQTDELFAKPRPAPSRVIRPEPYAFPRRNSPEFSPRLRTRP